MQPVSPSFSDHLKVPMAAVLSKTSVGLSIGRCQDFLFSFFKFHNRRKTEMEKEDVRGYDILCEFEEY